MGRPGNYYFKPISYTYIFLYLLKILHPEEVLEVVEVVVIAVVSEVAEVVVIVVVSEVVAVAVSRQAVDEEHQEVVEVGQEEVHLFKE